MIETYPPSPTLIFAEKSMSWVSLGGTSETNKGVLENKPLFSKGGPNMLRNPKALPFLFLAILILAAQAHAQGVGIVSGIRGDATVRHERAAQTQHLKFKDDVFWQDVLTTGADAQLRLLIQQKSVITMKELTQLQLRE